jgi:hypothetical protein
MGEAGARKYQEQLELVNKKIDRSGKISNINRGYWMIWLLINDPLNTLNRTMKNTFRFIW